MKQKPKKLGRPRLPKNEAKERVLHVRLNAESIQRIKAAAKASKQPVSKWVRGALESAIQ